jgi:hypothetical protein
MLKYIYKKDIIENLLENKNKNKKIINFRYLFCAKKEKNKMQ